MHIFYIKLCIVEFVDISILLFHNTPFCYDLLSSHGIADLERCNKDNVLNANFQDEKKSGNVNHRTYGVVLVHSETALGNVAGILLGMRRRPATKGAEIRKGRVVVVVRVPDQKKYIVTYKRNAYKIDGRSEQ